MTLTAAAPAEIPAGIPKVELHVHLEGTATPDLVRSLAARHGMALPPDLFDRQGEFA